MTWYISVTSILLHPARLVVSLSLYFKSSKPITFSLRLSCIASDDGLSCTAVFLYVEGIQPPARIRFCLIWSYTFDLALHRTTDNSLCEWICFAYVTGVEPIHVMVCVTKAHCSRVSHVGNDSLRSTDTTNTCIGCICGHTTNQSDFISLTDCMSVQRQFCLRPLPLPSDVTGEWRGKPNSQF